MSENNEIRLRAPAEGEEIVVTKGRTQDPDRVSFFNPVVDVIAEYRDKKTGRVNFAVILYQE